jgi:competence CoiA-like predicted nuclease
MRTITEVIDYNSEKIIKADEFFGGDTSDIFKQRNKLQEAIKSNEKLWVCPFCRRPIIIRGKRDGERSLHFSHVADRLDCPYKNGIKYTDEQIRRMKYNGQKESPKHYFLKNKIAELLLRDPRFSEIKIDKRFEGICNYWRKPDVSAVFQNKRIVFELQLTTTFLSVIVGRNIFYKNNETYIIWLFNNRRNNIRNMRFMEKDIFYPNHHNAFFIDENSDDIDFSLICGYEKPIIDNGGIKNIWQTHNINFSDLTFDDKFQVYWFNYEKELEFINDKLNRMKLSMFDEKWQRAKNREDQISTINELNAILKTQSEGIRYSELIALLNCLYSIKFQKVIGYNYSKLVQVLHHFFQMDMFRNIHFGEYALEAIGVYKVKNQILEEDISGKFVKKAKRYKRNRFNLSHKYDQILMALFPELFEIRKMKADMNS